MRQLMVVLLFAVVVQAQNSTQAGGKDKAASAGTPVDLASQVPAARAEDVKSMDALLGAIYDVISGPAGGSRLGPVSFDVRAAGAVHADGEESRWQREVELDECG